MTIGEACRKSGLTRKAILYYIQQGLICPHSLENGYRDFSDDDVRRLERIAVLRSLGLSAAEIGEYLSGRTTLHPHIAKIELQSDLIEQKRTIMQTLVEDGDWASARLRLDALSVQQSILDRLIGSFPGFWGKYIAVHFGAFLHDPIQTPDQQQAYEDILNFLDGFDPQLSDELCDWINRAQIPADLARNMHSALLQAADDPVGYLRKHGESMLAYNNWKRSEEGQSSSAVRLMNELRAIQQQNGYDDVFLPAMRRLSPSYTVYCEKLAQASVLLQTALSEG